MKYMCRRTWTEEMEIFHNLIWKIPPAKGYKFLQDKLVELED